ncbi:DNA-binding protein [Psychromarinibacter sp. C21-152]|uniref:DNA-binding protein n=1 Tax=Psychromarinibacter sediminicola TaxID=3033385 RepID=A0AAE3NVA7_9RHOB|nr:DNA-binding protein [Psychromarinibacter sediminicola]MDF0602686.1 DNA-binding protein [Psychromarinibacter sediminicola]
MNKNFAGNHATADVGGVPKRPSAEEYVSDPLIRDAQGAAMLGCSKATFWRRVADGTIPKPVKIGGMSRWRVSWIEAVISAAEAAREAA